MKNVKMIVAYPQPKDANAFDAVYQNEHVPLAVAKLEGKTKIVATKVLGSPQGRPAFYCIAEVHFPSMEALQSCARSQGGQETLAHAEKISSGGPPVVMIAEEDTFMF
jgi:uncharacterized protein (TIGR02118 family)